MISIPVKLFQKTEEERTHANSFYATLISKPEKRCYRKGKLQLICFTNTDVKILNKILANQIQQPIKISICYDQGGFIPGMQEWFNVRKSNNLNVHQ